MAQRYYLRTVFLLVGIGLFLIGSFNWIVDPYGLHESPKIAGFNSLKVEAMKNFRLTKPWLIKEIKPTAVILGTSRAGRGLSPEHPGWKGERTYNLSLPATSIYEVLRYFQHANAIMPLHKAVLALDFRSFNESNQHDESFESRLAITKDGDKNTRYLKAFVRDMASTLLSSDALLDSLKTIRQQSYSTKTVLNNGRWDRITEQFDHQTAFSIYTKSTLDRLSQIRRIENNNQASNITYYRVLLRFAYENDINLYMLISPSHARHWEAYRVMGLWGELEKWKQMLVRINQEEAQRANKPLLPLWDFSGYSTLTTEDVPTGRNRDSRMKWFWESIHYKTELGDLMLDRLFAHKASDRFLPSDFGVLITSENIDIHLANIRKTQMEYQASHVDDVEEIERMARESPVPSIE